MLHLFCLVFVAKESVNLFFQKVDLLAHEKMNIVDFFVSILKHYLIHIT
jgi:hypothetical protein